ncbi:hypothetical protein DRW07_14885 [Alteromonas sediminis]|uniref:Uncharacterized protein n=1 Tax=Alteromonas sediminis TaxID=2259342 RepID=A0A3N5XYI5_9ALTE|nr:hypothetical protein [Alteromonas sediminis]RPJ66082.1 hypothetical protein DRW07_14885 [Alteromonas sediminis]
MNKKHLLLGTLVFPIFVLLLSASLLGENHRAREIIQTFIEDLAAGNFSSSCIPVKLLPQHEAVTRGLSCEDKNFLFMVSLLSNSDFKQTEDIGFETEVNQYWIPFLTEDYLKVGLSYKLNGNTAKLSNLFVIKREEWSWSVSEIQITDQKLSKTFTHFKNALDLSKYVIEKSGTYELQDSTINLLNLSPLDKMVLKYNLQRIYQHLE